MTEQTTGPAPRRNRLFAGAALAALAALAAGLYGIMASGGNAQANACAASAETAARMRDLARGDVAAVQVREKPQAMNEVKFAAPDGKPLTLADFRGRTILLNLWATWCAPCRHEMPALDRLQKALGGPDFEVVAINIDQRNLERPATFLKEVNVTALKQYADASARIFQDLRAANRALGMPTTLIIDGKGCDLAILHGPAEWAGDDAMKMLRAALGR
jgi:thiol-disulfide isomerase/thioredoxin